MFQNRKLIIATKHQKEGVIAPMLEKALGVKCYTDADFDTDAFGTFTGETDRKNDAFITVREKCLSAMRLNQCDLGVASEGSFGPHPSLFFIPADDELLIFIDLKHNIEIIAREVSTSTNFNGKQIRDQNELMAFAQESGFPDHALILRKSKDEISDLHKGITDIETLHFAFHSLCSQYGSVYAETDMRAMFNPTRMQVIEKATHTLVEKIKSVCPRCNMPGFGITEVKKGLKCSSCGSPTQSILSHIYVCQHCTFTQKKMYPKKQKEDPMYCDYCNP